MTEKTEKRYQLKSLANLRPSPTNPRTITKEAFDGLKYSVESFGDISGITWNERSGNLVCGHQRVKALTEAGAELKAYGDRSFLELPDNTRFPVRVVDWDDDKEAAANLAANNQAIAGKWTHDAHDLIARVRERAQEDYERLQLANILKVAPRPPTPTDDDGVPEPPKDPVTKLGDVWRLGRHTVVCGDSATDYTADSSIDLLLTDPPYGVEYIGKTKDALTIANDGKDGLGFLLRSVFAMALKATKPGACWYVSGPAGPNSIIFGSELLSIGILRQTIVWIKDSMVLGHSDYHYQHEPIFYGWTPGGKHRQPPDRMQTTAWMFDRPKRSTEHPTMKPIALFAKSISNSSIVGDAILDPFLGSGTTLIAAEQLDRTCYGIEIEPAYVDVTIERWENLTGQKAKRVTND